MAGLARMVDDRPDTAARVVPEPKKDPDISDNSSRSEFPARLRLEDGSRGKLVSGGVLNGTAMELPKPPTRQPPGPFERADP